MLTCQGCMRHCLQAIIGDSISLSTNPRIAITASISRPLARNYTSTPSRSSALSENKEKEPKALQPWQMKMNKRMAGKELKSMRARAADDITERETSIHLRYLRDPIKLAEFVRRSLRQNNFDLAQKIVKAASPTVACIVSWNHLIEWQLSKGRMNAAFKVYNEMKRRAQVPDAQTYTIIFNGCSQHNDSKHALEKVLTLYNSMLTERAPIKPNTIHLNAVLKMCARAGNMEAMFSIVDQMPAKGLTAPNNLTYTTILNALRIQAAGTPRDTMTPMQMRQAQQDVILHARHIWAAVIKAWRQGDIWIDEELVCAMGRILLIGNEQDHDDILSLVEQTMNIPRQVPRKGTDERHRQDPASQGQDLAQTPAPLPKVSEDGAEPADDAPPEPISPVVWSKNDSGVYVTPGQNTLSLVIQSLTGFHLKEVAGKYWHIFTNEFNVVPDSENYHAYLRVLRLCRSSTETVNAMMKMPQSYMQSKTFRISMSTCLRDKNNHHAFANAGKILDLMQTTLREPEIQALQAYLEVALTSYAAPKRSASGNPKNQASKYEQGRQIRRALDRLQPSFLNLKSALLFRDPTLPKLNPHERLAFVDNILAITRRMISAYDVLMNNALVPREDYMALTSQRSKLAAFVTRHKSVKSGNSWKDNEASLKISRGAPAPQVQQ
ncbi:uncharacterized protein PAC_09107 [Phialocephala subalpina]|uniref:Pentatricopeptide repeat protein n=1 Tax=Phialocephala subalpina TaxID=576137 RepID=A0A1L7X2H4_9HELO|nr:uncharacterized protein PAC_09107 [Phialocephala subalpina]